MQHLTILTNIRTENLTTLRFSTNLPKVTIIYSDFIYYLGRKKSTQPEHRRAQSKIDKYQKDDSLLEQEEPVDQHYMTHHGQGFMV